MAFNNIYPVTYQPYYQPIQQPQAQPQPQPQSNSIVWVQGEAGAKSYMVGVNSSVILMDSENPFFYIKTADQAGMPTLRKFRFEEVTNVPQEQPQQQVQFDQYITRDEFEKRIAELNKSRNNNHRKQQPKKEVEVDG